VCEISHSRYGAHPKASSSSRLCGFSAVGQVSPPLWWIHLNGGNLPYYYVFIISKLLTDHDIFNTMMAMKREHILPTSVPVILAPLAGVSTLPFRLLNRQFGCKYAFTEMICARSLSYSRKKTLEMIASSSDDRPLGIQLLGENLDFLLKAMEKLEDYRFDVLDLNAACPTKKVTGKGKGASLLKTPRKLNRILKTMIAHSSMPVTVKIRLGWDTADSARDIALYAEDAGIKAICVHGRTKVQGYSGDINYTALRNIKKALNIPVIASGNILSGPLAKKMFNETGCDSITVARGALGNPWIFKEIDGFLTSNTIMNSPNSAAIAHTMKVHLNMLVDTFGEKRGIVQFRKFYLWYTRGFHKIKPLKIQVSQAKTLQAIMCLIQEFKMTAIEKKRQNTPRPVTL